VIRATSKLLAIKLVESDTLEKEKLKKSMSNRSTKQKEISREQNRLAISHLSIKLRSEFWNLNPSSFQSCEEMPLDFVEFNKSTCRYQYSESYCKMQQTKKRDSGFTDDDAIAQSMVVYLLYRMEKGWGNQRSYQALPIWGGKPAKKDKEDDPFPLENLWEEEIKELIASKKLGMTSLNHFDNFDSFTRLYDNGVVKDRWSRRSSSYLSRVHELGEQATIQMALYLHEHVSHHYATLAGTIIHHALGGGIDDPHMMPQLAQCLMQTARREAGDNFPKAAYELIEYFGQNEQDNTEDMRSSSTSKRQRIVNK